MSADQKSIEVIRSLVIGHLNSNPQALTKLLLEVDPDVLMEAAAMAISARDTHESLNLLGNVFILVIGLAAESHNKRDELGQYAAVKASMDSFMEDIYANLKRTDAKKAIDAFNSRFKNKKAS